MNITLQIPLGKLRRSHPINKIELTHIDSHLTNEQKKRIAQFFRKEAAKRTKYDVEPVWTLPESVTAIKVQTINDSDLKHTQGLKINLPAAKSSPLPNISDNIEESKTDNTDEIEIATSPIPITDSESETDHESETNSEEEPGIVEEFVNNLLTTNQGSYVSIKKNLSTAQTFMKSFEGMSKTQMKKQAYKEKTKHIKALKKQYRP